MDKFFNINLDLIAVNQIIFMIIFAALFFVISIIIKGYLIPILINNPALEKRLNYLLPLYETIIWILFFVYFFYVLAIPAPFIGALLLVIFLSLTWKSISNLINGLFVRFKGNLNVGQRLSIDNIEGIIHGVHTFDLVIETGESDYVHIPYRKFANKSFVLKEYSTVFYSDSFTVLTPLKLSEKEVSLFLLKQPWVFISNKPKINISKKEEEVYQLDITVYVIDKKHTTYLKDALRAYTQSI